MNSKKNQQIETNCATCHVPWRDRRRATCSAWRSRPQTTSRRHLSSSSSSFSSSAKKMRVVWSRCRRRRRETRKDIFFETTTTTENNGSSFSWSSTQLNVRRVVRRASARQTEEKRRMTTCREGQLSDQIRQTDDRFRSLLCVGCLSRVHDFGDACLWCFKKRIGKLKRLSFFFVCGKI